MAPNHLDLLPFGPQPTHIFGASMQCSFQVLCIAQQRPKAKPPCHNGPPPSHPKIQLLPRVVVHNSHHDSLCPAIAPTGACSHQVRIIIITRIGMPPIWCLHACPYTAGAPWHAHSTSGMYIEGCTLYVHVMWPAMGLIKIRYAATGNGRSCHANLMYPGACQRFGHNYPQPAHHLTTTGLSWGSKPR